MVLSDRDIKREMAAGRIRVEPLDEKDIQPASVDVRLGSNFRIFKNSSNAYIDPTVEQHGLTESIDVPEGETFVLHPGMRIGQMSFERMSSPSERPYGSKGLGSHYQGQSGATPSSRLKD